MLITALDEFHARRMIDVGDSLAGRMWMLTAGIEKGTWNLSRRLLVCHQPDMSLVSDELMGVALNKYDEEKKREKALAAARGEAPRH